MFANHIGYSDITPFQVIRTVSDKCLEIRAMSAELDKTWEGEWHAGGFAGHCANQGTQRWIITPDNNGRTVRIRLNKSGQWKDAHGNRYKLDSEPVRFYDFNF